MSKPIGPTFHIELEAAKLIGLPFSWGDDGVIEFNEDVTETQKEAILQVYEKHDPTKTIE